MRLLSFFRPDTRFPVLGVDLGDWVGDLAAWDGGHPELATLDALAANGPGALDLARRGRAALARRADPRLLHPAAGVRIDAPLRRPGKLICFGFNYRDHVAEVGLPLPPRPVYFAKFPNAIIGPGQAIVHPRETQKLDYEAELAVVMGRTARRVPVGQALDYVLGYTCLNDVSARDLQLQDSQWLPGKVCDTFAPMGPYLVTAGAVPDPQALDIRCLVNGQLRQDSNTGQMIFAVAELISYLSLTITLEPGDIIATGTPPGVGMAMKPEPQWLRPGDTVRVEIAGLGALENPVAAEA